MTVRLLCIANPRAYDGSATDIPLSYSQLAAHPEIELFHADTTALMRRPDAIEAAAVPPGFAPADFAGLDRLATGHYPVDAFDVAFCRTLKPFPRGYLAALRNKTPKLRFVNDPGGIETQLRPDFVLDAARPHMPPAVMPKHASVAEAFAVEHGMIVAKRANSCGGRGVFRVWAKDGYRTDNPVRGEHAFSSFKEVYDMLTEGGTTPVLLVRYLPRVIEGERRVVAVDGEVYGAYLRRSADGHWVQNLSMGGTATPAHCGELERRLVQATSPHYARHGIHILGYDLLRDDDGQWTISEINAGNIGGLFRLEQMGAGPITDRFVRWLHRFAGAAFNERTG